MKSLTVKQEAFCQAYMETSNATEAYRRAYNYEKMKPASVNRKAFEVMENVNIAARLVELAERAMIRHDITVDNLTTELIADRKMARGLEQASPAITATMAIAKLHGLDINKSEHSGPGGTPIPHKVEIAFVSPKN